MRSNAFTAMLLLSVVLGCSPTTSHDAAQVAVEDATRTKAVTIVADKRLCPYSIHTVLPGQQPCRQALDRNDGTCPNKDCPGKREVMTHKDGEYVQAATAKVAFDPPKGGYKDDGRASLPVDPSANPPAAHPLALCPHCSEPTSLLSNRCPTCKRFYWATPDDELAALDVSHEQLYDPSGKTPVDPTLCVFADKAGKKPYRRVSVTTVCWRCGGCGTCPECLGSGNGFRAGSSDCWFCGRAGQCPECNGEGFTDYFGALPPTWDAKARKKDDWKLGDKKAEEPGKTPPAAGPAGPPAGGGDELPDEGEE